MAAAAAATKSKRVCVMDMCVWCVWLFGWLIDWSVGVEWSGVD